MPRPTPTNIWNQFGGAPTGSGFRLVNSTYHLAQDWHTELPADVGTSCPVTGPDGTIYIGTIDGQVVAVDRQGPLKWSQRIAPSGWRVATPAVSAAGDVYCLCTTNVRDHRTNPAPTNSIVSVGADGSVRWTAPVRVLSSELGHDTGQVHGAPRIVSHGSKARVAFVVRYTLPVPYPEVLGTGPMYISCLAIVDERGSFLLFNRFEEKKLFVDAHGGGGLGGGAVLGDPPDPGYPRLPRTVEPCADTPVVFGTFPATEPWTIVASARDGLYAIRWNEQEGAIAGQPKLVWSRPASPAPTAFPNGLLAATSNGGVDFLETDGFSEYLPNSLSLGGDALVAGGLRHMYFLVRPHGTLLAVDPNGTVWKRKELRADSVAFPVVTANYVYVCTMSRVWCLTLDLENAAIFDSPRDEPCGLSSPAIGEDGSVYFVNRFQGKTLLYAGINR